MVKIAVFMGSKSDQPIMEPCVEILKDLGIPFLFTITSAHRTPERTARLISDLEAENCQVYICAAGLAAHLAGAVAARTLRPVIGVPISSQALVGLDSLLSTVQMPPGFPVATVALDKVGAKNAAWLAAQILALHDLNLAAKLKEQRAKFQAEVETAAAEMS